MNHGFHPAAESEHLEQVAYYEAQKPGLGQRYLSQVEATIARVCESPQLYRIDRVPHIRRAPVFEFPFQVIFRESNGVIEILAVSHSRRRPQYWLSRL